jgi:hypothetical protein
MTDEQKKKKILKPYTVRVRVQGTWWEEYEVEAENSSDAWDNWMDGYQNNNNPIDPKAYEWEVDEVEANFFDDEYDDD